MCKNIIPLKSRYGYKNSLIKISDNSYKLQLDDKCDYLRISYDKNEILFIDPPGGPFIQKDAILDEINSKIKSIKLGDKEYIIEV